MIYDLSHLLNNDSPVFPGDVDPVFKQIATIEANGYSETRFHIHSHLGTHIDAPAHMLKNGKTLDEMDVSDFYGKAIIIKVDSGKKLIEKEIIDSNEKELEDTAFVLFKTGWSKFWGDKNYFEGFPCLSADALQYLLQFNLKGIGFDTISADPVESTDYSNHYAIFNKGLIIIENLIFPNELEATSGEFSCFPLPYEKADGSPVRAVLNL
ncbi:cyclase family protein [Draconibacterium sp. IB214405]|uniref:cyclase family protein n=1 Tax=Draconibacterium sp. IB214405 TaxID=3097352 RepID=UPI002A14BE1B|nr:cyclase family protein [Draconibacterium sp. IB214405]MDX8340910.1 cyclase family protein [Draconibacterium sp. IB214405]